MNRRQFITASALLGATGFASSALSMALPRKGAL
jgi:nitrous oxide reductase